MHFLSKKNLHRTFISYESHFINRKKYSRSDHKANNKIQKDYKFNIQYQLNKFQFHSYFLHPITPIECQCPECHRRDLPFRMGSQSRMELDMKTMPFLDTVAGEALSMLWTSKMILQLGAMGIRSPLAKVRVLLSSNTEFNFSIQIASTGPSNRSQTCSPCRWISCYKLFSFCFYFLGLNEKAFIQESFFF